MPFTVGKASGERHWSRFAFSSCPALIPRQPSIGSVRRAVAVPVDVVARLDEVPQALVAAAKPGDVVITLGAGSIGSVPDKVIELRGSARGAHVHLEPTGGERDNGKKGDASP